MKKIFYSILDVLYPGRCPVCHRILKDKRASVCPECRDTFRPVRGHYCLKCGKPVKSDEEYCRECGKGTRSFDRGRGVFLYDGIMRRSLVRYKYYGCREYGDYYGEEICRYVGGEIRRWAPDVIVPVPLYKRKLRMRGFNQSAYLARKIGETLGMPVSEEILVKIQNTRSQKKLGAAERKRNLVRAFRVREDISGLTVLVVDDVFTTGATIDAAAACLKAAGAEKVFFTTLCIGRV